MFVCLMVNQDVKDMMNLGGNTETVAPLDHSLLEVLNEPSLSVSDVCLSLSLSLLS